MHPAMRTDSRSAASDHISINAPPAVPLIGSLKSSLSSGSCTVRDLIAINSPRMQPLQKPSPPILSVTFFRRWIIADTTLYVDFEYRFVHRELPALRVQHHSTQLASTKFFRIEGVRGEEESRMIELPRCNTLLQSPIQIKIAINSQ